jgi:GT2 family glycosyltransferase
MVDALLNASSSELGERGPEVWCCEFELSGSDGLRAVVDSRAELAVRVLVRLHGEPMGYLHLARIDAEDTAVLVSSCWEKFGGRLRAHLDAEGLTSEPLALRNGRPPGRTAACANAPVGDLRFSAIVCTRNRSAALRGCLERLARVDYPDVEFIIVDNAPADDSTEKVIRQIAEADARFRYVVEPVPGLSHARNRGLAEATGAYVAYTDDDVSVDPGWIGGLARGFARRKDVTCVTGLVCTASIANIAEAYFDARNPSWSARCVSSIYDLSSGSRHGPLYPYELGIFGTGASFAFHRQTLRDLGGFDAALGAGTATRGGEDLDAFLRILRAGGAIAYEPAALVWHHHRADHASLLRQMFGYGAGLSALLAKLICHRSTRREVLSRVPAGLMKIATVRGNTRERLDGTPPPGALRQELAGFVCGPLLYLKARRRNPAGRPGVLTGGRSRTPCGTPPPSR